MQSDREKAGEWAKDLLSRTDWIILDTETTGLTRTDEIIQIAVLSSEGVSLMDTLIRPTQSISAEASAIHGISDEDVQDAPRFHEIYEELKEIIKDKVLVIYNADFDLRLLNQTGAKYDLAGLNISRDQVTCAMRMYSAWVGEMWGDGTYKWQKLVGGDHTAIGDCRATLAVIEKMARETVDDPALK